MRRVQPIRDPAKIEAMKNHLKEKSERNYIMFLLGISIGLRISDILGLVKEDLLGYHMDITERKRGKHKRVIIPGYIKSELVAYANTLDAGEYIIKSRQKSRTGENKAIDRSQAYRILKDAAQQVGLKEIGTHTLRKTFGYHFYLQTKDVVTLQKLFNHDSQEYTLMYIGYTQDSLDNAMRKFRI